MSRKRARLLPPVSSAAAAAAAAEGQETTTVSSIEAEIGRIDNELDDLDAQAQVIEYERMSLRSRREQLRAKLSDASAKQLALKMRKEWGDDSLFNWSADVEAAKTSKPALHACAACPRSGPCLARRSNMQRPPGRGAGGLWIDHWESAEDPLSCAQGLGANGPVPMAVTGPRDAHNYHNDNL